METYIGLGRKKFHKDQAQIVIYWFATIHESCHSVAVSYQTLNLLGIGCSRNPWFSLPKDHIRRVIPHSEPLTRSSYQSSIGISELSF
jgi:hypothetical protein